MDTGLSNGGSTSKIPRIFTSVCVYVCICINIYIYQQKDSQLGLKGTHTIPKEKGMLQS